MKICKNCNTKNNDLNSFCTNCKQPFDNLENKKHKGEFLSKNKIGENSFIKILKTSISIVLLLLIIIGSFLSCKFYVSMVGYVLHINIFMVTPLIAFITSPLIPIWLIIFLFIKPYLTILHIIILILVFLCAYFLYILTNKDLQ